MDAQKLTETLTGLTAWEAKERAGLLALETDEWREKRLIAEDPNTTGDVLTQLAQELRHSMATMRRAGDIKSYGVVIRQTHPLSEALALHPNTPLSVLAGFIAQSPQLTRAFCRNPITPFLLLERPDFVARLPNFAQQALLNEADAPSLFVQMLATGGAARDEDVQETAQMHVSLKSKTMSNDDWLRHVRDYWKKSCYQATTYPAEDEDAWQWPVDLAELELAPRWASRNEPMPIVYPFPEWGPLGALRQWFASDQVTGSDQEKELLETLGPDIFGREHYKRLLPTLSRILRADVTATDVRYLLNIDPDCYHADAIMLLHPASDADTVSQSVMRLLQSTRPLLRRFARSHPAAPPNAVAISRRAVLAQFARRPYRGFPPFVSFVACLHSPHPYHGKHKPSVPAVPTLPTDKERDRWDWSFHKQVEIPFWTRRLGAVLLVDVTSDPLPGDPYARSGLDLLHHVVCREGNRLVRWAAQTRLADPDFTFTWHEGNE